MAVSKRLRYEVLRRDNHTCRYCGAAAPDVKLTVDHIVPETLGGTDEASNLVAACQDCNAGKSSSTADAALVEDVDQDAMRWSNAMKRAAETQRGQRQDLEFAVTHLGTWWEDVWLTDDKYPLVVDGAWHWKADPDRTYTWGVEVNDAVIALFDTEDEAWEYADRRRERYIPPRPDDWRAAAAAWLQAGITDHDYVPLMEMVRDNGGHVSWDQKWKYFAGCVWNVLRERQEIASDLLEVDDGGGNATQ